MLRISKLTDYATVLMAELARQPGECLPARQLAEQTHLELPTVSKVLKSLGRAGLVQSVRGVKGGYCLASEPESVSVAAVVRAMEGPIALTECALEAGLCSHEPNCQLRGNWQRIGVAVETALEALSVADLARPVSPRIAIQTRPAESIPGERVESKAN
jgi:FeS assembly SUF system regulator